MTDRSESARLSAVLLMESLSQARDRLRSIGEDREFDQVEIIAVIDHCAHDGEELRAEFPWVHLVEVHPDTSRIQRRRAGFAAARGDIVIFSDAGDRSITARLARMGRSANAAEADAEIGIAAVPPPLHAMPPNAPEPVANPAGPSVTDGSPAPPTSVA